MNNKSGILFVITAPSGAGKSTLVEAVLKKCNNPEMLDRVITYTTRDARAHERQGVDYHFVSKKQFQELKEQGFFLESSEVYGNSYGSPKSILEDLKQGKSYIMILDAQGVASLQAQRVKGCYIALTPSSRDIIVERLAKRGSEDQLSLEKRKNLIDHELEALHGLAIDYLITNDSLVESIVRLGAIIEDNLGREIYPK